MAHHRLENPYRRLRSTARLLTFAVSMTVVLGLKAPLDYSVFTGAAAALALAAWSATRPSVP